MPTSGALPPGLSSLIRQLSDALDADPALDTATVLMAGCVQHAGIDDALVMTLDESGHVVMAAASTERARTLGLLQLQAHDGPMWEAARAGRVGSYRDLEGSASPWPSVASAMLMAGIVETHALPLRRHRDTVGAVQVFLPAGSVLAPDGLDLVQMLADAAAIGILTRRELDELRDANTQLQTALDSRVLIEQAKGILAARMDMSVEQAFTCLRRRARQQRRPLLDLAEELVLRQNAQGQPVRLR